ncbi:MAG TPA: hypothetical protein VMC05_05465 [Xanthobacteraceae bacterium]|nr:hypothetical protein [Xanthobacteraceae bacterium]
MADCDTAFFYRCTTIVAGFVAVLAVISYFLNAPRGLPIVSTAALAIAAAIWLGGWACRRLLAGD